MRKCPVGLLIIFCGPSSTAVVASPTPPPRLFMYVGKLAVAGIQATKPETAGTLATAEKPETAGTLATVGKPATAGKLAMAEMPVTAGSL